MVNRMNREHSMGKKRNAHKAYVFKPEGMRSSGRSRGDWRIILK
jgi:hypothetical protein